MPLWSRAVPQVTPPASVQVSLDKLYMSAANHVFEKKMKPLLLEQRKKGQGHGYNKETFKVAKTMMKYIHCIQSPEWAAATAHKITQELPPGLICTFTHTTRVFACMHWLYFCPSQDTRRRSHSGSVWLLGMPGWKIQTLRSVFVIFGVNAPISLFGE